MKEQNEYLQSKFVDTDEISEKQQKQLTQRSNNIITSFDYINLIGWKYHESQQQPKSRGTAEFSLAEVVTDINEKEEIDEFGEVRTVKYGVLMDDGENVIELDDVKKR